MDREGGVNRRRVMDKKRGQVGEDERRERGGGGR